MRKILLFIVLLFAAKAFGRNRIFVKADAPGINNGVNRTDVFYVNLQNVIKQSVVSVKDGVKIYGSYTGTESLLEQPNGIDIFKTERTAVLANNVNVKLLAETVTQNWAKLASGAGPSGIAIDALGNVYTANTFNSTVSKITPDGILTKTWATLADYANPSGIAIDALGNVYTVNAANNTVSKITHDGIVTQAWASLALNAYPNRLAIDALGNVYTVNYVNSTVSKITPDGTVTQAWATLESYANPSGIAIDASGNVYTANYNKSTVSKITPDGTVTPRWAVLASDAEPQSLAIDASGNVYTANFNNDTISKITPDGTLTEIWAKLADFSYPYGITIDALGNVYTINIYDNNLSKITPDGTVIQTWAALKNNAEPHDIAVDAFGNVYTANYNNDTVSKIAQGTLPLSLLSFTAALQNKNIKLQWQTEGEVNTSHFNIQRSLNGTDFITVGKTDAIGNGDNKYTCTDGISGVNTDVVYYRLQHIDADGSFTYSKIVSVALNFNDNIFTVYPNPAKDVLYVSGNNVNEVRILDSTGKVIVVQKFNNTNHTGINISGISKGFYIISVKNKMGHIQTEKLIVE